MRILQELSQKLSAITDSQNYNYIQLEVYTLGTVGVENLIRVVRRSQGKQRVDLDPNIRLSHHKIGLSHLCMWYGMW